MLVCWNSSKTTLVATNLMAYTAVWDCGPPWAASPQKVPPYSEMLIYAALRAFHGDVECADTPECADCLQQI